MNCLLPVSSHPFLGLYTCTQNSNIVSNNQGHIPRITLPPPTNTTALKCLRKHGCGKNLLFVPPNTPEDKSPVVSVEEEPNFDMHQLTRQNQTDFIGPNSSVPLSPLFFFFKVFPSLTSEFLLIPLSL